MHMVSRLDMKPWNWTEVVWGRRQVMQDTWNWQLDSLVSWENSPFPAVKSHVTISLDSAGVSVLILEAPR